MKRFVLHRLLTAWDVLSSADKAGSTEYTKPKIQGIITL